MASKAERDAIKVAKVLMVGAGGIGCELLKTLVMSGFQDIELIDMDTIEVSNLNRQFLFRKKHVGQSKAQVAREAVLKFRPDAKIVAHHANVKDPQFDIDFIKRFTVVLNGLDNVEARRHVNRLCLAAGVPLVESGTTGYVGQADVHIKGRFTCFECYPPPPPKSFPTCTITNTPSQPVHCIVWAKELPFAKLFGEAGLANDLDMRSDDQAEEPLEEDTNWHRVKENETPTAYACRVFDKVFGHNVAKTLEMDDLWKNRQRPKPLYIDEVLPETSEPPAKRPRTEGANAGDEERSVSAASNLGLRDTNQVWSLQENARVFLESVRLFLEERASEIGSLRFDKDDTLAVEFVTSASNLRDISFGIQTQSLFAAKGIAGNIVHAIATTNAIVAGMIVIEATKIVTGQMDKLKTHWCEQFLRRKMLLWSIDPNPPNPKCYVCSDTPLFLEVDTNKATLGEVLQKIVKKKLAVVSPMVLFGNSILYETGDDLDEDEQRSYAANAAKVLSQFPTPIGHNSLVSIDDSQQDFRCTLHIVHRDVFDEEKEPDMMVLRGEIPAVKAGEGTANGTEAAEDDDDDLTIIDNAVQEVDAVQETSAKAGKRKRDEEDGDHGSRKKRLPEEKETEDVDTGVIDLL
ncbi:SMT3/SUMO-activating complex catalytic component UBA2 [Klebsormidium nitens]|uniref:SUMO-activating enzyme subunit n=1 Tax=Klebsormidium nitens TaxID=105231 RepID=A0A1Y1HTF5_KLENI|nr:SMT3/SUMO-activating complex catalytic component UBA2 [Klebsormidium nitens]|eukprot:GAQ81904.1 SMT3/SUMO-activating complex catalytic component UBA2 [Klebsormidium nitens]